MYKLACSRSRRSVSRTRTSNTALLVDKFVVGVIDSLTSRPKINLLHPESHVQTVSRAWGGEPKNTTGERIKISREKSANSLCFEVKDLFCQGLGFSDLTARRAPKRPRVAPTVKRTKRRYFSLSLSKAVNPGQPLPKT